MSMNAFYQLIILSVLLSLSSITGNTLMFYFHILFDWKISTNIYALEMIYQRFVDLCTLRHSLLMNETKLKVCVK